MKIMLYSKKPDQESKALQVALSHAKAFNGSIDLVAVIEDSSDLPQEVTDQNESKLKALESWITDTHNVACNATLLVSPLSSGEALIQYAQKNDVAAIVMGLRRRSRVGKLFFGSSTQYVVLEADCPVTTVRET